MKKLLLFGLDKVKQLFYFLQIFVNFFIKKII